MQQAVGKRTVKFSVQPDDIERRLDYSREAGAEEALAVRVADLTFRESRRRKCEIPGCPTYLTNTHCPPKTPDARWMQSCLPPREAIGQLSRPLWSCAAAATRHSRPSAARPKVVRCGRAQAP